MTNTMNDIKDDTDSIAQLASRLDQAAVRCFIRQEMWAFLVDMGWTAGAEPPPLRQEETVAKTPPSDSAATARLKAESELLRGKVVPSPAVEPAHASDGRSRAERLRAQLGLDAEAPATPSSREGS